MRYPDDGLNLSHFPLASAVVYSLMKGSLRSLTQHTRMGVPKRDVVLAAPVMGTRKRDHSSSP